MTSTSSKFPVGRVVAVAAVLALAAGGAAIAVSATEHSGDDEAEQYAGAVAAAERLAAAQPGDAGKGAPETRDARRDPEGRRARPGAMPPFDFGWGAYRGGNADLRRPREQEWAETQLFMNRYSPRRTAALEDLPEGDRKEGLRRYVFARYRTLMNLQKRDRATYEQRVAQLGVEDEIYGLVSDAVADPAAREGLRDKLRAQVNRLIELDLEGRRRRVEWLKRELAEESEKLEQDQKSVDAQVDKRVSNYAQWADRWAARKAKKGAAERPQDVAPDAAAKPE